MAVGVREGDDPAFDKLLYSLGSVSKHCPRSMIDAIMTWRKARSDSSDLMKYAELQSGYPYPDMKIKEIMKERRSLISNFILCRVLIEITKQLQPEQLPEELGDKLEDMVFSQFKNLEPESISRSVNRQTNADFFAELIGVISNIRFASVSDKFKSELNKAVTVMKESKVELLIHSMRFLKLKLYPMEALEDTAEFLQVCSNFFQSAHSIKIKHAYAEVFVELLDPIAAVADAEVNLPMWTKSIDLIYPKATKMINKPRHYQVAYPLVTTLLCVSRKDFFLNNWIPQLELCFHKFKDKSLKHVALSCVTRLLWVYLYRCSDSSTSNSQKRLDSILKILFPVNRKIISPSETSLNLFVQIVYFITAKHLEYGLNNVILMLLNSTTSSSIIPSETDIAPERIIIGIRAFLLILSDLEEVVLQNYSSNPSYLPVSKSMPSNLTLTRFGISVRDVIDRVNEVIGRLALSLEQSCGSYLITDDRFYTYNIPIINSSNSSMMTQRRPTSSVNGEGRNSNEGLNNTVESQSQILPGTTAPISSSTSHISIPKERQMLFYLTKTYLNALPRCTPTGVGSTWMLETIVKYVYHIDEGIRMAATEALKRIAKIDDENAKRCSLLVYNERFPEILVNSVGDTNEGYGGYNLHSINKLFVELLEILYEDVKKENSDFTNDELINMIGKIEGRGLLLLSSCLPNIRKRGVEILKLSHQMEKVRKERFISEEQTSESNPVNNNSNNTNVSNKSSDDNKEFRSIITLMENIGPELVKKHYHDPVLATSSRTEFHKFQQRQRQQSVLRELENKDSLIRIAESEEQSYIAIWSRCYPDLIRGCFNSCSPITIANCLASSGSRLFQLMPYITISLDQYQGKTSNNTVKWSQSNNWNVVRPMALINVTNEMIDQWKFYLIYIASTIEVWNPLRSPIPQVMAIRKQTEDSGSKKINVTRAEQLFKHIAPLLSCEKITIRQSAVLAFGCINSLSYKTLLEILQPYIKNVLDDVRTKYPLDPKTYSSVRRSSTNTFQGKRLERLRMELAHIFSLIADFITYEQCRNNDKIMDSVRTYIIEMIKFLSDNYIQFEWDHQMLRYYFCGFIERLYDNLKLKSFLTFDTRYQLFKLFENWCGYGQLSSSTRDREARMMMSVLSQVKDGREKGALTTTMEEQRKALEMAALKAMSCLCKGEIIDPQTAVSFDLNSLFYWIDSIFSSPDEKFHVISKSSLKSLLIYNPEQPKLLESIIRKCYTGLGNISQGYFTAIVQIFYSVDDYPCKLNQMLTLTLYKISDPDISIRRNAIQLLKVLESRFLNVSWVEEYESSIGLSSLPIIYKNAQLAISSRLAKLLPNLTCEMISEITYCIELISSFDMANYPYSDIRNMFDFLLPWVVQAQQRINTKRHPILSNSDVMLTNLFYLTIKFGNDYYAEMEQIWSNLIDMDGNPQDIQNPQMFNENLNKNISIIIDFLLSIGVRKRNPAFVLYSKMIIVYISRTYACKNLIDTLIENITPITLIPEMGTNTPSTIYVADLDNVLLEMPKRPAFSKGQLAAVLFVDAAIEIGNILLPNLPILLHVIIVQLDHFITLICEQSRLLLLNLIQSILPKSVRTEKVNSVISLLIEKEGKRMWSYEDVSGKNRNIQSAKELSVFVEDLIEIFYTVDPNLRQTWGTLAIEWGTSCPVRHVACRSFQIFRTLMPMLNQKIMGNLFVRLSYTLGDVKEEIQGFAYEILITLNAMITSMSGEEILAFPQFFWACVAILYGPHEWEYLEGVVMLEKILNKISLNDPKVSNILLINLPTRWKGQFTGLQMLLLKGLNSSLTEKYSLNLINKIALLEQDDFVDKSNGRVLFSILANLPNLLLALEYSTQTVDIDKCLEIAGSLAELAEMKNYTTIAKLMESYSKQRFRDFQDFLTKFINSIREVWFPNYELQTLQLLMGLLSNSNVGNRRMTLKVLKISLPYISSRKQYSALEGIEEALVAPLLSLLRTELSNEALEVLDEAMKFTDCKRDIISIAEKHSLKSISSITQNINKEVDESTGWSVSDPETASEYIKYNMAGVSSIGHSNQEIYSVFGKKSNQQSFDSNNDLQLLQTQENQIDIEEVNVINILDDLDEFFDELYENQNSDFQTEGSIYIKSMIVK
ncbi:hypothetical protein PIROE2DRAFT_39268 [Piromyces sp. E2]|nr:hypothetical protein PIROE2DRAFT_39268 [Piromyces sp. E2]|eukprot:OUM68331.1 hypothetical protein PIROE2DRAFT_39268 [Piromyces sp. E2]